MQLNLFEWDIIAVGSGYASLARLAFSEARSSFNRVLHIIPDHHRANQGMHDTQFWERTFHEIRQMTEEDAFRLGWDAIRRFPFDHSENHRLLRLNVLGHLQTLMNAWPDFYDPPHLCSGFLLLQLGRHAEAEQHLQTLLNTKRRSGPIHLFLAEALWLQGKTETACLYYAKALLLDPAACAAQTISNQPLAALCLERGPELTPVYGFMAGLLPLVKLDPWPETAENRIYIALRDAELAKRNRDHTTMIAARGMLKRLSPEIFQEYLTGIRD
jgi:tetratricopeptide (TPR) repeat protein